MARRRGSAAMRSKKRPHADGARVLAVEPRLRATAIQTVGEKGYDGFALALVL